MTEMNPKLPNKLRPHLKIIYLIRSWTMKTRILTEKKALSKDFKRFSTLKMFIPHVALTKSKYKVSREKYRPQINVIKCPPRYTPQEDENSNLILTAKKYLTQKCLCQCYKQVF